MPPCASVTVPDSEPNRDWAATGGTRCRARREAGRAGLRRWRCRMRRTKEAAHRTTRVVRERILRLGIKRTPGVGYRRTRFPWSRICTSRTCEVSRPASRVSRAGKFAAILPDSRRISKRTCHAEVGTPKRSHHPSCAEPRNRLSFGAVTLVFVRSSSGQPKAHLRKLCNWYDQ